MRVLIGVGSGMVVYLPIRSRQEPAFTLVASGRETTLGAVLAITSVAASQFVDWAVPPSIPVDQRAITSVGIQSQPGCISSLVATASFEHPYHDRPRKGQVGQLRLAGVRQCVRFRRNKRGNDGFTTIERFDRPEAGSRIWQGEHDED